MIAGNNIMNMADTAYTMYEVGTSLAKMFASSCYACKEKMNDVEPVKIAYHPKYLRIHPDNYKEAEFCSLECFIKLMRYRHYYLIEKEIETNTILKMVLNLK